MPLASGTKLGPYEIVAPVGAGGMGEVYRARDTRLSRSVAVKVLSGEVSANPDFRQRFEREARTISALQHPNICTLHDIGQQDGVDFLVLEFVEGETLDARLEKGPLPVEQALRYSAQIADALDKAHRLGIVHRDLKPGNIMLTRSGAKLLDFGLAQLQPQSSALSSPSTDVTMATQKLTAQGTLVGTFQYMSPEQLEGKEADHRSDIFALGAVIYEMATGKAAFAGKSRASLIAAIMSSEPAPISSIQPMTPPALDRVVKRCLAKDPDDRWQSAGDLSSELRWIAEGGSQAGVPAPGVPRRNKLDWRPWTVAAACAILALVAGLLYLRSGVESAASIHAYLPPPLGTNYFFSGDAAGFPVISKQGDQVAFVAVDQQARRLIWIRSLSNGTAYSLAGTEGAFFPFWSPDGKSVAYFAQGKLKRIPVSGGPPVDIADAPAPRGGNWGPNDTIIFAPATQAAIFSVSTSGGTPKPVTTIDTSRHTTHRWPYFLPDGKHFIYLAANHAKPHAQFDAIYVGSLDGKEDRLLTAVTSNAVPVPGYLLYLRGTTLVAQPFDLASATLKGDPVPVAQDVHYEEGNWRAVFDCASDGTLIYQSAVGTQGSQLLWFGRDGHLMGKLADVARYSELGLSPDGHKLAVSVGDPGSSIWVYDLPSGVPTRYTFAGNSDRSPIWSPDGKQIAFYRLQPPASNIFVVATGVAGTEKPLFTSDTLKWPTSWSPDGKFILFTENTVGLGVSVVPTSGDIKPQEFLPQKIDATEAVFSPDGHWVAYTSQESGRLEVYVTEFPGPRGKWQVSNNGGSEPRWRRDGKALFYWAADDTLTEAQVDAGGGQFRVNAIHPLFRVAMAVNHYGAPTYDVTPDGQRFIVNATTVPADQPLSVVTNWAASLGK
jgi:eukaryotic-like serine/threonine-protein kinase